MKDQLRLRFRTVRDALGPERREKASKQIAEYVMAMPQFQSARVVAAYASFGSEVSTEHICAAAASAGKTVALPRIVGRELHLHPWTPHAELAPNRYGILEPLPSVPKLESQDVQLVLVPGLAFDGRGARLGYGGGYYDRLLSTIRHAYRVGLCFEQQVVPGLPSTHLDAPMDCLVTELGVKPLPRRKH